MLFLSRKVGESIVINKNILITVTEVRTGGVKLSFTYPEGAEVLRKEVFDRIEQENKLAAQSTTLDADFATSLHSFTKKLNEKG
ncbi:carbon storage regulator [Candidatus Paracaedibacter symbiosus]|uniref:carbon storage regulator n=1 Tax=Candidatus Paracaedibacter symbiosus TaxID=244582 RepID=UPI00094EC676|nr:carbon storage regulator [Candidatus Paracaedibacter symbiosus]